MIEKSLKAKDKIQKFVSSHYNARSIFFIGRGLDYALSMEGSLKLKEISYIHSEAYAAGELKHGTISLIEKDMVVFGIVTDPVIAPKTISNLKETKARGSRMILVTTKEIAKAYENDNSFEYIITVNNINPILQSLTIITTMQLISYYVALLKGENIDQPRNLAKSVTVE